MPSLVTGLFYERKDAENAVEVLKAQGIPTHNIYLEAEVQPPMPEALDTRKVGRYETERRFAGCEVGLIIGGTAGLLAGAGIGTLGGAIQEMILSVGDPVATLSPVLSEPMMAAICGMLIGLIAGGCIGFVIDNTLTRLGAGPARPQQETLVTVRVDDERVDRVYGGLMKAHVRHLHAASNSTY